MREFIKVGSVPSDETISEVGEIQKAECQAFIRLLRETFGNEPDGASLKVKQFSNDNGHYYSVVCFYNDYYPESFEYAHLCKDSAPSSWEG